jgi:hypothetical protein
LSLDTDIVLQLPFLGGLASNRPVLMKKLLLVLYWFRKSKEKALVFCRSTDVAVEKRLFSGRKTLRESIQ